MVLWCPRFAEYHTGSNSQEILLQNVWRWQGTGEFHATVASISVVSISLLPMTFTFFPCRGRSQIKWAALHASTAGHPKLFFCCSSKGESTRKSLSAGCGMGISISSVTPCILLVKHILFGRPLSQGICNSSLFLLLLLIECASGP